MFGAVAAGSERGGYDHINEAAKDMGRIKDHIYQPIENNVKVYEKLFDEYSRLYDYFGRGENNVMKTLKQIKKEASLESKEDKYAREA